MTTTDDAFTPEQLELRYVPLSTACRWRDNKKKHDLGALAESIRRYGFQDPPKFSARLNGGEGGIVEGNGRVLALSMMHQNGEAAPRGIALLPDTGEWAFPMLFGVDHETEALAAAYAIDHNNLTLAGGDFTVWDVAGLWDEEGYKSLLMALAEDDVFPVSVDGDDLDALLAELTEDDEQETLAEEGVELMVPFRFGKFAVDVQLELYERFEMGVLKVARGNAGLFLHALLEELPTPFEFPGQPDDVSPDTTPPDDDLTEV